MKHLKQLLAAALTMLVALAVATPALASSITITPQDGALGTNTATYHYYELLHASLVTDDNGNVTRVSYYLNNGTDDALRTLLDAVKVDGNDLFTFTKSADGSTWVASINKKADGTDYSDSDGAAIAAALSTNAIKAVALADDTFAQVADGGKADNLEDGYYLVTSTLGTNLVVQTLNDVTIETKNEEYTSNKTASKTNMAVGDIVTYTVTVSVPASAVVGDEVTVHDTLDAHLAIDMDSIAATVDGADVTLADGTKKVDTETFAKKFAVTAAMLGKDVTITYDAELLSTAADDTGYVNDMWANTPSYETVPTKVKVYTFDFDLDKNFQGFVTGDDASEFQATFELYPQVKTVDPDTGQEAVSQGTEAIKFITDATGYVKVDSDDGAGSATITIDQDDLINVRGLEAGTYYLVEKTTSDGYNLLADPVIVTITDTSANGAISHAVSYKLGESGEAATGTVTVLNQSGSVLPSTGGIGTTIFYVVGGALVITAGVLLVTKRRMANIEG